MSNRKDQEKIKDAFEKVKSDILYLYEKIKYLEEENRDLKVQIEDLKKVGTKNTQKLEDDDIKDKNLDLYSSSLTDKSDEGVEELYPKEEEFYYIGHKRTNKLHKKDCYHAKKIQESDRKYYSTLDEGLKDGCELCNCLG